MSEDLVGSFLVVVDEALDDSDSIVTSVRMPAKLRDALSTAVDLGFVASVNETLVDAARERLEVFAQQLAIERIYSKDPTARPSLAERAKASAALDGDPIADHPDLIERAAHEMADDDGDPSPGEVRAYATALSRSSVG